MTQSDDDMLEGLFADARAQSPSELPSDLRARMMADAAGEFAKPVVIHPAPSLWSRALDAIGGWASVGGLATAAVSGVYFGFSNPDMMDLSLIHI